MSTDLIVKGRRYHRPRGDIEEGNFTIPNANTDERLAKLDLIEKTGLFFTVEFLPTGLINLCLDDGKFDFKFEVTPNGPELIDKVLEIIDEFDVEKYCKAAEDNARLDEEGLM